MWREKTGEIERKDGYTYGYIHMLAYRPHTHTHTSYVKTVNIYPVETPQFIS